MDGSSGAGLVGRTQPCRSRPVVRTRACCLREGSGSRFGGDSGRGSRSCFLLLISSSYRAAHRGDRCGDRRRPMEPTGVDTIGSCRRDFSAAVARRAARELTTTGQYARVSLTAEERGQRCLAAASRFSRDGSLPSVRVVGGHLEEEALLSEARIAQAARSPRSRCPR